MNCPACGCENAIGVLQCVSCGRRFGRSEKASARVGVRVSRVAIASSVCALVGAVSFIPGVVATLDPRVLYPRSDVVGFSSAVTVFASMAALVAGIVGLVAIGTSGGRRTGWVLAWVAVALPVVIFSVSVFIVKEVHDHQPPRFITPNAAYVFRSGDTLLIGGAEKDIETLKGNMPVN